MKKLTLGNFNSLLLGFILAIVFMVAADLIIDVKQVTEPDKINYYPSHIQVSDVNFDGKTDLIDLSTYLSDFQRNYK